MNQAELQSALEALITTPGVDATAALGELASSADVESTLRRFELGLLDELGYSFSLEQDGLSGDALEQAAWYHYHPDHGLVAAPAGRDPARPAFAGEDLLALARGEFEGTSRATARRLMRQVLALHLGDAPLKSRDLFSGRHPGAGESS